MGFLDKVNEGIGAAAKRSEDLIAIAKIKSSIAALNKQKEEVNAALGRLAYTQFRKGELVDKDLTALCEKLKGFDRQIVEMEEQLSKLQSQHISGGEPCPHCGKSIDLAAVFCASCGGKIDRAQIAQANAGKRICTFCGYALSPNIMFCPKCGTKGPEPDVLPIEDCESEVLEEKMGAAIDPGYSPEVASDEAVIEPDKGSETKAQELPSRDLRPEDKAQTEDELKEEAESGRACQDCGTINRPKAMFCRECGCRL